MATFYTLSVGAFFSFSLGHFDLSAGLREVLVMGFAALSYSLIVGLGPGQYSGIKAPFLGWEAHNSLPDWSIGIGFVGAVAIGILGTWSSWKILKAKKIEFFVALSALIIFSQAHYTHRHPLIWFLFVMIVVQSINSETKASRV